MSVIVLLILFSLVVAIIFLILFIWSVKSGQYDDTYSPSVRILFDEKQKKAPETPEGSKEKNGNEEEKHDIN